MHPLVRLAKDSVESYIREGKILEIREEELAAQLCERAGVFICLKINGVLRGCIGSFHPQEPTVAHETVRNAISAATRDPRFASVRPDELPKLEYTVDVLAPPEPVKDRSQLDPKRYGVIVQTGAKRGLLLPDLDGVDSVDHQISIAMQKAGIPPGAAATLYRFEVKRYTQTI